ncbi:MULTISPECIES: AAA family ATPase [unclassified Brevundimonas]|uniref:AAA family ATPase n=1 Tax=unclassified Brevundimonas TaxID=2622653 RepID=UPI0025C356C3|nr:MULTISPECIES: AAA family ATPase [unclassified Brevundimonas]
MSQTLEQIAQTLHATDKKVQLIYAFNGTGKTRLSSALKELIDPKTEEREDDRRPKTLYYNAFTEDLFYWDNDLTGDVERKLKIHPNAYTKSAFEDLGLDVSVITTFQRYTRQNLSPRFSNDFLAVTFSLERGDNEGIANLKISKGEESNFIWSVFFCLLDQAISARNVIGVEDRETQLFNDLQYVFIDDPVSSLDENHLIQLAVDVADLIRKSDNGNGLKFVITTHNPLFYNVLHNELKLNQAGKREGCRLLEQLEDGTFKLDIRHGDSNRSFSYHLYLRRMLAEAIERNTIERFHFMFLRNLYEKTAAFLGYREWGDLLNTVPGADAPGAKQGYLNRVMQFSSHSTLSGEQVREPTEPEKQTVKLLYDNLINNYGFVQREAQNG